jgi:hypothetical protein
MRDRPLCPAYVRLQSGLCIEAIELAAEADLWLKGRNRDGQEVYAIPSQADPGRYYIVTRSTCDCPDFRHNGLSPARLGAAGEHRACKHILAVRLHSELVKAQQDQPRPNAHQRRARLKVLPTQD